MTGTTPPTMAPVLFDGLFVGCSTAIIILFIYHFAHQAASCVFPKRNHLRLKLFTAYFCEFQMNITTLFQQTNMLLQRNKIQKKVIQHFTE